MSHTLQNEQANSKIPGTFVRIQREEWLHACPEQLRTAAQLLEDSVRQGEICLIPESLYSPLLEGCCICPSCQQPLVNLNDGCGVCGWLYVDTDKNPSKDLEQSCISPSNESPSKKRRQKGNGNGSIYWRTHTKNGKDYPQAYYHWQENGQKKTKYIPKPLLKIVTEAEAAKRPVKEILGLLGFVKRSSNLLGDKEVNPSKDISPSKMRRDKGEGSGTIHWRIITKNGKDYPQAYYHYEFWNEGSRLIKSTKYIPKRFLSRIQELEAHKAPVREVLKLLGVKI